MLLYCCGLWAADVGECGMLLQWDCRHSWHARSSLSYSLVAHHYSLSLDDFTVWLGHHWVTDTQVDKLSWFTSFLLCEQICMTVLLRHNHSDSPVYWNKQQQQQCTDRLLLKNEWSLHCTTCPLKIAFSLQPNDISVGSAIFVQLTVVPSTHRCTHHAIWNSCTNRYQ